MYDNLANKFRDELNPGEKIFWSAQPQQGFLLRSGDISMILFGIMIAGIFIFWEYATIARGSPSIYKLWVILPATIGVYIIFGRFFVDSAQRRKTFYAVTNERIIIISGLIDENIKSLNIKMLPEINIIKKRHGKGTIIFGPTRDRIGPYIGHILPNMDIYNFAPRFERIDNIKTVYENIKLLQREGA